MPLVKLYKVYHNPSPKDKIEPKEKQKLDDHDSYKTWKVKMLKDFKQHNDKTDQPIKILNNKLALYIK